MLKTHKECIKIFGSDLAIAKALSDNRLFKVDRGIYADKPFVPFIEIVQKRYSDAVIALDSAFFYQGLTDIIPLSVHLATVRTASRIADKRIVQHFVPNKILNIGVIEITYNNSVIKTYDLERLAIDVVRMKTKLPYELYKGVILSLRSRSSELYPAKIDDYLDSFPYHESIADTIRKEIF